MKTINKKDFLGKKKETIAISQIFILLIATFAFVWMIGEIPGVSAEGGEPITPKGNENCLEKGGTCSVPASGSKEGDSCNNDKGIVKENLCSGSFNNMRCCIPAPYESPIGPILKTAGTEVVKTLLPVNNPTLAKEAIGVGGGAGESFLGGFGNLGGAIVNGLGAIASSYTANRLFSYIADQIDANGPWTIALEGLGAGAGAFAYLTWIAGVTGPVGWIAAGVAVLLAVIFGETVEEQGAVIFYCRPWDAQTGGQHCEECNIQEVPCSEYQCKSLGQACEFIPSDETREGAPFCFHNNSNDIDPPVIMPNSDVLSVDHTYENPASVSPPDRGTKIINTDDTQGCLSPFQNITFGVKLDEPAKCRISFERRPSYNEMSSSFGKSGMDYNHTITLVIPEINTSQGQDNQIFAYVRCQDANGNANPANYVFQMCVQEGPDINPPLIYGTSIENKSRIAYNVTSAPVDFYINEPSNCKWSFTSGRTYDTMENNMSCSTRPQDINARLSYTCSSNLTGIRQNEDTHYYVKCQDVSPRLNTNVQDYVYSLTGSRALSIVSASPNNTVIRDSTSPATVTLKARTIGGTYDGSALCYYSNTGVEGSYIIFDNSSSTEHSTNIYLYSGLYNYFIRCHDGGGNSDRSLINFSVQIDSEAPLISRAYYEEGSMKIITSEEAECKFSTESCEYNFDDGVNFNSIGGFNHKIGWQTESDLYIKCQDIYGNRPASPNECSIIVRGYNYKI